jgi:hypothetical protein
MLTDDIVMTYLQSTHDKDALLSADDLLTQIKAKCTCNLAEQDPDLRISQLVSSYLTTLRKCRMADLYKDSPKLATEHLCELIRPFGLRNILKADRELHFKALKKDFVGFVTHCRERAVAYETYHGPASQSASSKKNGGTSGSAPSKNGKGGRGGGGGGDGGGGSGNGGSPKGNTGSTKKTPEANPSSGAKKDDTGGKPDASGGGTKSASLPLSLNKDTCPDARHLMKNCPKSSDDEEETHGLTLPVEEGQGIHECFGNCRRLAAGIQC